MRKCIQVRFIGYHLPSGHDVFFGIYLMYQEYFDIPKEWNGRSCTLPITTQKHTQHCTTHLAHAVLHNRLTLHIRFKTAGE